VVLLIALVLAPAHGTERGGFYLQAGDCSLEGICRTQIADICVAAYGRVNRNEPESKMIKKKLKGMKPEVQNVVCIE
jgi:hypothetical protein